MNDPTPAAIVPTQVHTVFEGRVITLRLETIMLPKGHELRAEIVRHPGSVVIVPVTDAGEIMLVRQYRHAIGQWAWELPAGSLKSGEDPQTAAVRECHEEVGLIPTRVERIGALFATPGYCDEQMTFFRAVGLRRPESDDAPARPDDDEDIEPRAFSVEALRNMIADGKLFDMKTVAGVALLLGVR